MNNNLEKIKNNKSLLSELKKESCLSKKEICGFIKNEIFNKVKNSHPDPENFFLINPADCVWGEEVVLFHSHPTHIAIQGFSDWDLENQRFFTLDKVLYSVNNDEFYYNKKL